ncbi:hypothetical protein KIN20_003960 [Parelaphostrongylus tenuis]|uniref:Uncharacterized protein n=1 Tax=Parelaphostrongylus tenuis TaxID=148309 RepID=A0AAD5LY34_PARTN|nr:hypothetical protein KIN20_003960 [Parelaphostrongylus tenuis]
MIAGELSGKKPSKAVNLVSMIIFANGEDLHVHDASISLIKQLLMLRIPILYEEILYQILKNEIVADMEVMITHSLYYWCNEHPERLKLSDEEIKQIWGSRMQSDQGEVKMSPPVGHSTDSSESGLIINEPERCLTQVCENENETSLLEDMEMEIETNNRKAEIETVTTKNIQGQQFEYVIEEGQGECGLSENDDDGPFEIIDLGDGQKFDVESATGRSWSDGMSVLSYLVPKALACSGVESASLDENLRRHFNSIIEELINQIPDSHYT